MQSQHPIKFMENIMQNEEHPAISGIRLCFGGNVFGWALDRDASFAVLDAFYEAGGRMIDTAECYSFWVPGNKGGESETIMGEWMENRGVRSDMRIATKTNVEAAAGGLAPDRLATQLDASLERLRSDYIDLYYAHRDDAETPQDEVAAGFDALVKKGKVKSLGASNFTADRLTSAIIAAQKGGYTPYTVMQDEYNLVSRDHYEKDMLAVAEKYNLVAFPYYGLASGYLTGKYRKEADFGEGVRGQDVKRYHDARGQAVLAAMDTIAKDIGASLPAIALAWLGSRSHVAAPIASATSVAQLQQLLEAASLTLNAEQLSSLDQA